MVDRLKFFVWRHQLALSVFYLAALFTISAGLTACFFFLSSDIDTGLTITLRSLAYWRTFDEVKIAEQEMAAGKLEEAQSRLSRFVNEHSDVQPDQLFTDAVSQAHELLAEVYRQQEKQKKAVETLDHVIQITPRNYRLWYLKAQIHHERGEYSEAAEAFREAFKLAPNHPEVTEAYFQLLGEMNAFKEILWVYDHYERAGRRATPSVQIKIGQTRSKFQRKLMEWANVPVEHGFYARAVELFDLPRGRGRVLVIPASVFHHWHQSPGPLYLQLRFENIYNDLKIEALRYLNKQGARKVLPLIDGQVSYLHTPHSGAEYYAEINTGIETNQVESLEIVYSCPEHKLSTDVTGILAKAKRNFFVAPN